MFERTPEILDVTLRDGSYLIDFQFTAADTARIAAALEAVVDALHEALAGAAPADPIRRE